jgi:hypothetical protein
LLASWTEHAFSRPQWALVQAGVLARPHGPSKNRDPLSKTVLFCSGVHFVCACKRRYDRNMVQSIWNRFWTFVFSSVVDLLFIADDRQAAIMLRLRSNWVLWDDIQRCWRIAMGPALRCNKVTNKSNEILRTRADACPSQLGNELRWNYFGSLLSCVIHA